MKAHKSYEFREFKPAEVDWFFSGRKIPEH